MVNVRTYLVPLCLVLITAFAGFLRYESGSQTTVDTPIRADALDYYFASLNLKLYSTYSKQPSVSPESDTPRPDALRPPLYSIFLMPMVDYPPSEKMIDQVIFFQVMISILMIPLLFFALRRLIPDELNLLVALFLACSPHLIVVNSYILTESIYTFSIALILCSLAYQSRRKSALAALLLGAAIAISALIRPTSLYLIPFVVVGVLFFEAKQFAAKQAIFVLLGFVLIYSPWAVRNQIADIAPTRSLASDTLQKGMYPGLMYQNDPRTFGYPNRFDPKWSERSKSTSLVLAEIYQRFLDQPGEYLKWYLFGKPLMFMSWDIIVGAGDVFIYPVLKTPMYEHDGLVAAYVTSKYAHWLLIALAFFSIFVFFLPSVKAALAPEKLLFFRLSSIVFLYFILVHVAGTPLPRYSIPLKPVVFVLAMAVIYSMVKVVSIRPSGQEDK